MEAEMTTEAKIKKGFMDYPLFRTSVKSAEVKPKEMILGYFLGPFLAFISNAIFGSYINRYYSDVIGWTNKNVFGYISVLLPLLSVVVVIVGNLLSGRLIDKTRTSQGKSRPYLLLSSLLLPVGLLAIILIPSSNTAVQMIWICVSYNIYYSFFYPIFYASHSSMVALSTRDSKKRGLLSTFSNASGVAAVGIMASMVVPMFLQSQLFVKETISGIEVINAAASYNNWKIFIFVLSAITFIGVLVEYYNTRERVTEEGVKLNLENKKIPMIKQIKAVVSDQYWWVIILYFLLFQLGGLVKNGSMTYFCDYVLEGPITGGQAMGLLGLIGGIPTALGMVVAWPIANKLTKQKSILIGMIISVLGGFLSFIDVHNFYWVCAGIILKGIGSIPAMYVTLALLSDVLDHLEAKNGFRSDGFTMSVYGAIMVGLVGVSMAFINFMLLNSNYDPSVGVDAAVKTTFVITFLVIELICYAIIAALMIFLNVEKYLKKDHEKILANQKAEVLAGGGEWLDPAERLRLDQKEAEKEESEKKGKQISSRKDS
jgi:GPH family glycoside/pentoside/hexuronide:cation symporter